MCTAQTPNPTIRPARPYQNPYELTMQTMHLIMHSAAGHA